MEFNWNWFMGVDFRGRWLITRGQAYFEVSEDNSLISGVMCLGDACTKDSEIYAKFFGKVSDDSEVVVTVASTTEDVPPFEVSGTMFGAESENEISYTFVLTDGTTVLGFSRHSTL
ncbi:hypothetical protein UNDYM_3897 [Undibacterium sp. YM2]|uniref:hypothetical protein n=1 Tax=Undibacterium sp. YM2 TaxID=2058625 RepID=UPI001331DD63|nr:hypothetical protein [Undibacterium sp. YM2]BBB68150.1 hypothetical protein UNDYM_3897 [Undibacterium sp. YM2]